MQRGIRPSGDLIPWTVSEQFQDKNFGKLTGVRIVRIATHPSANSKGYGSKALELL
jgi:N-acetyltransferase 10